MKLYSATLEQAVLVTVTDGLPGMRNRILAMASPSHFGFEPAREVYEYIIRAIQTGEMGDGPPRVRVLVQDKAISKRARQWLDRGSGDKASHPARLRNNRDVKKAMDLLGRYRRQRIADHIGHIIADEVEKDNPDHDTLFGAVEALMLKAHGDDMGEITHIGVGDNADAEMDDILSDEALDLIPSGWPTFDQKCLGFARGDLIFEAANYGGGKTTTVLRQAASIYKKGYSVLVIPLEMSKKLCHQRLWAGETGIDFNSFRSHNLSPEEKDKVRRAKAKWKAHGIKTKKRFSIWAPGSLSVMQAVQRAKPYGYDVIVIDYINLLDPPPGNKDERVQLGEMARMLKLAAKPDNLNCVMIVLAQLNDDNKIKYARAMAEHADYIFWWRMGEEEETTGVFTMHQDKARNSQKFSTRFRHEFDKMQVHDMGEASADRIPRKADTPNGDKKKQGKPKDPKTPRRGMSALSTL